MSMDFHGIPIQATIEAKSLCNRSYNIKYNIGYDEATKVAIIKEARLQ